MAQMIRVPEEVLDSLKKIKEDTGIPIGKLIEKYAMPHLLEKFCEGKNINGSRT